MSVDWEATGSMLQGWGAIGSVAAILFAACKGNQTFESWKRQKLAERRFELAERILVATYNARLALAHVRQDEGSYDERNRAAEKLSGHVNGWQAQTPERTKRLTTVQVYYERLNSTIPAKNELVNCLPVARALYGEDVEDAITELRRQFHVVQVSAEIFLNDDGSRPEFSDKLHLALCAQFSLDDEKNEVSEAIDKAVKLIEDTCLPALRLGSDKNEAFCASAKARGL